MRNRILTAVLCLLLLIPAILPVNALEESESRVVTIKSAEELVEFAENCRIDSYSLGLTVYLLRDIDLSEVSFSGIPIFQGTFCGNGHKISGLNITGHGSSIGFFRYLTQTALVQDLTISGNILPEGSREKVGSFAGENRGKIINCSFIGDLGGNAHIGGIAGINHVTGIIDCCSVSGNIYGNHFVGGIAGTNYGVIRTCTNQAPINTTAQENTVQLEDVTISSIVDSESANTTTDIGGIAGLSSGVIRDCANKGSVGYAHMGYNIGGIAGTQSGYINNCQNYAMIQGRKEVGGIVGQMEPTTFIEFSTDTFQILRDQLETMGDLVNRATTNVQANASGATYNLGALWEDVELARSAVETLIPDLEDPQLPDDDTLLAAGNTISASLGSMQRNIEGVAASLGSTISGLSRDLQAVSRQIDAMAQTLNDTSETLGGSVIDISDEDTEDDLSGKVAGCTNYGTVSGDLNIGGITGAISIENDLDVMEDWYQVGEQSFNFDSQVRAVVLGCENNGQVTGKSQQIGGIVGLQSLGLVKECINYGSIAAADADHIGGISGRSNGFIRNCSAKCYIEGNNTVGGIAGSACIVSDCRSLITLSGVQEAYGAILGILEDSENEELSIEGNFYYPAGGDIGAIDGISYSGKAEPLSTQDFTELKDIPEAFRRFHIRFVYEDGSEKTLPVSPGGALNPRRIPAAPEKNGHEGFWDGLAAVDLSNITSDMTFHLTYIGIAQVIQSQEMNEDGIPRLLMQGEFLPSASLSVTDSPDLPPDVEPESVLLCCSISLTGEAVPTQARLLAPEAAADTALMVKNRNGTWERREFSINGSYVIFTFGPDDVQAALIQSSSTPPVLWIAGGAILLACIILLVVLLHKRRRKNKQV